MGMKLTILGSGTIVPSIERSAPAYILKVGRETLLIDMGPGLLRQMKRAKVDVSEVDIILISHFHPDHTSDFVPFIFATKYALGSYREKDLTILAPRGFGDLSDGLERVYGDWIVPEAYDIFIEEMGEGKRDFGNFSVTTAPVNHNPESIAFRVDGMGGSFVYSGDTDFSHSLIELAGGVDLLLLECAFPDEMKVPGHLTPTEAGKLAAESEPERLVLTHFYPPMDEVDIEGIVRKFFGGEVIIARDLMTIEFGEDG